jgi:peptidoglycan/LPS O-acetylase OafA/YrhL
MIISLNSFRFFTAFGIFLYHVSTNFLTFDDSVFLKKIFDGSTIFMSGFFVLSGFILSHIYHDKDFTKNENLNDFYFKRLARIYPVYIFVTILYFLIFPLVNIWDKIFFIMSDAFFMQSFFENLLRIGINNTNWSVAVEAFLYLTFPFLIILSKNRIALLIFSLVLAIFTTLNSIYFNNSYIYANPFLRLSDFIIGILCYYYKDLYLKLNYQKLVHLVAIALLIFICFISQEHRMSFQIFTIPLFGIWIINVFYSKSIFYNNPITNYLGLISYSFYLWQSSAIALAREIDKNNSQLSSLQIIAICFAINLIISIISYHLIEEKSRKYLLKLKSSF